MCARRYQATERPVRRGQRLDNKERVRGACRANTQIYEGTNQIQRMVMAQQLLKG
jgi:alkylation response protein AidB-like acyl-CoA dehydrogenase